MPACAFSPTKPEEDAEEEEEKVSLGILTDLLPAKPFFPAGDALAKTDALKIDGSVQIVQDKKDRTREELLKLRAPISQKIANLTGRMNELEVELCGVAEMEQDKKQKKAGKKRRTEINREMDQIRTQLALLYDTEKPIMDDLRRLDGEKKAAAARLSAKEEKKLKRKSVGLSQQMVEKERVALKAQLARLSTVERNLTMFAGATGPEAEKAKNEIRMTRLQMEDVHAKLAFYDEACAAPTSRPPPPRPVAPSRPPPRPVAQKPAVPTQPRPAPTVVPGKMPRTTSLQHRPSQAPPTLQQDHGDGYQQMVIESQRMQRTSSFQAATRPTLAMQGRSSSASVFARPAAMQVQPRAAQALYDYVARAPRHLTVAAGEALWIIDDRSSPDWWLVQNRQGQSGYAPANRLRPM